MAQNKLTDYACRICWFGWLPGQPYLACLIAHMVDKPNLVQPQIHNWSDVLVSWHRCSGYFYYWLGREYCLSPPLYLIANTIQHAQPSKAKWTVAFSSLEISLLMAYHQPRWLSFGFVCPQMVLFEVSLNLLVAGKHGCSEGDALTIDSVYTSIQLGFIPLRALIHGLCTVNSSQWSGCSLIWSLK